MRLCVIGCKDYICISNVLPENGFFTKVLPLLTSVLSTDSLVTLSSMPGSNGWPGSHFGFAAFTAAYIAEQYFPSYCCKVHVPFARSSFFTLNWYSLKIYDLFVVSPFEIPFSRMNSLFTLSNIFCRISSDTGISCCHVERSTFPSSP